MLLSVCFLYSNLNAEYDIETVVMLNFSEHWTVYILGRRQERSEDTIVGSKDECKRSTCSKRHGSVMVVRNFAILSL
jgi:hypothetical protein